MKLKQFLPLALALACALCCTLTLAACGDDKPEKLVKLTKEQWETAIRNTLDADNYACRLERPEMEFPLAEIFFDGNNKAMLVKSELGKRIEDMEGKENIIAESNGGVVIYYRDGAGDTWSNKPFVSSFYGDSFDKIFARMKIFDGEGAMVALFKDKYDEAVYDETDNTYTVALLGEYEYAGIEFGEYYEGTRFVVTFDGGYVSALHGYVKLDPADDNESEVIIAYSGFGTTSVSIPAGN